MERKQLSFKVKFLYGDQKSMRNTHIYIYIYVGSYVNELLYTRANEHKQQINIQREGVEGGGGGKIVRKKNCY